MYDAGHVWNASYCSADVANHALREYGGGSMGQGIRKLANKSLTIGRQQGYDLGYNAGARDAYSTGFKAGKVNGSITCACAAGLIGLGIWCTKKIIDYHNAKKEAQLLAEIRQEDV